MICCCNSVNIEAKNRAKSERFIAVLDGAGFQFRKGPPIQVIREMFAILMNHYPYSIDVVYVINTSQAFLWFFDLLKPLLSPKMKSKIAVVSNRKELDLLLGLN